MPWDGFIFPQETIPGYVLFFVAECGKILIKVRLHPTEMLAVTCFKVLGKYVYFVSLRA